ncbi:MAG TPA: DUF58 domain-containing protein [Acidobacteriota bacterium]|nr:DUF58 domain-containing protein [Acidobacteriota bacterium]
MIPKEILRKVKRLEITTRGLVNDVFSGEYHSVFKGRGMDFSEVREYHYGDDIRNIDWNVTARSGRPYVKVFEEERELTVMLLVDVSRSGEFGSAERMKGEIAVELCALLAFSAIKNNDKVGLIIFTDRIEKFVPPRKGRSHVLRVLRELLYFKPEGRGTDIGGALEYLMRVTRRRAVVFLVSDFISQPYRQPLKVAAQRHDVVGLQMIDRREMEIPAVGFLEVEDAESGEHLLVDTGSKEFRKLLTAQARGEQRQREDLFRTLKVDFVEIFTDRPYFEPLVEFFRNRARRIR